MTESELELLNTIRTGPFKEVRVKLRNGQIFMIEKDWKHETKMLGDILQNKDYDTITIKRENGRIVSITQTLKVKKKL